MYAVNTDMTGFREIFDSADVRPDEHLSLDRPTFFDITEVRISAEQFWDLFTYSERTAIFTAAEGNIDLKMEIEKIKFYGYAIMNSQEVITNVNKLETFGLIGSGRSAEILQA